MKTAMQELIDKLKIESNFITKDDHIEDRMFKKGIDLAIYISNQLLEKEKEQIIQAHGLKYYDIGEVTITGENYYNQTYNRKQHIIDIMKADEDNDLYNQIN
jgi:hypothetical protein